MSASEKESKSKKSSLKLFALGAIGLASAVALGVFVVRKTQQKSQSKKEDNPSPHSIISTNNTSTNNTSSNSISSNPISPNPIKSVLLGKKWLDKTRAMFLTQNPSEQEPSYELAEIDTVLRRLGYDGIDVYLREQKVLLISSSVPTATLAHAAQMLVETFGYKEIQYINLSSGESDHVVVTGREGV